MNFTKGIAPRAVLGLTVLVAAVAAMGTLAGQNAGAASKVYVNHVNIVNLSDQSFGVTFTTSQKAGGASLSYGASCAKATKKVKEVKGSDGSVHLVNMPGGLTAGTTYVFKLTVAGTAFTNKGHCYAGKTLASTTVPPPPATIYGSNVTAKGCDPKVVGKTHIAPGSLVALTVSHAGLTSTPLAVIADHKARWAIPFSEATDYQGKFMHLSSGDPISYTATVDPKHTDTDQVTYDGSAQIIGPESVCIV